MLCFAQTISLSFHDLLMLLNQYFARYDEGSIMVKVGREEPAVSMDVNGGKIIWARHSEIQQANLKAMGETDDIKDGERLPLVVKDMGSCDIFPQTVAHNPNGRLVIHPSVKYEIKFVPTGITEIILLLLFIDLWLFAVMGNT